MQNSLGNLQHSPRSWFKDLFPNPSSKYLPMKCVPCAIEEKRRSMILFLKIEKAGTDRGVIKSFLSLALHCWCFLIFNRSYRAQGNRESADSDPKGSARTEFTPYRAGTGVPKRGWVLSPKLEMIINLDVQRKTVLWSQKGFQKVLLSKSSMDQNWPL